MKKVLFIVLSVALSGCSLIAPKPVVDPAVQAHCRTMDSDQVSCQADATCEYFTRTDGKMVCRAAQ